MELNISKESIKNAHEEALAVAHEKAMKIPDEGACGFAWVSVNVDGRSKVAKLLKEVGFSKSYFGGYHLWSPAKYAGQSVHAHYVGAHAYAKKFKELTGIDIYAGSRLD